MPTWYLPSPDGEGSIVHNAHREQDFSGACALHSPSPHVMAGWPLVWRTDTDPFDGWMLRRCPHGVCLSDPDDLQFRAGAGKADKGDWCDECRLGDTAKAPF